MSTDAEKLQRLRIHFVYWVLILIIAMIVIATDRWSGKPDFTQYLTNAATMTSLVLALVAIFYSFVSNDSLSKSFGNIATVANEVRESKDQISRFLAQTTSSADTARSNTEAIDAVSHQIGATLTDLNSTLSAISQQSDALNKSVSALPSRLDLLESKVIDATKALGEKTEAPRRFPGTGQISEDEVGKFVRYSPLTANLIEYACVLSFQTGKPLSLPDYVAALELENRNWLAGFLSCMNSMDVIDYKMIADTAFTYNIREVHPTIVEMAKKVFVEYVDRTYKDDRDSLEKWHGRLQKVEKFFAAKPAT